MQKLLLRVSFCLIFVVEIVFGHRYGADPLACDSMKPGHGTNVRQTRATPYIIDTNLDGYVPCSTVGQRDCGVIGKILISFMFVVVLFKITDDMVILLILSDDSEQERLQSNSKIRL